MTNPAAAKIPPLNEAEWQRQVTDLAELFGWSWAHFRPAQTARGWRTPVSGPLGAGFPDLVLVRPGRHVGTPGETAGRLVFAELKREAGRATPEQQHAIEMFRAAGCEAFIWRPGDLDAVMAVLR